MTNVNRKYFIYILVFISFLIYLGIIYLIPKEESQGMIYYLRYLSSVVTIDLVLIFIFSKWLWKWKALKNWLVPFPNLNGTWKGFIQTTWVDPKTDKRPKPIPVILTINQTFFKVSCVMRTKEMTSYSFTSEFSINQETQMKLLVYTYNSNPKSTVRERSEQHFGTMLFQIIETPNFLLKGEYWTGRKTTGEIELDFWKKEKLENYPEDLGEHPVSKIRKE